MDAQNTSSKKERIVKRIVIIGILVLILVIGLMRYLEYLEYKEIERLKEEVAERNLMRHHVESYYRNNINKSILPYFTEVDELNKTLHIKHPVNYSITCQLLDEFYNELASKGFENIIFVDKYEDETKINIEELKNQPSELLLQIKSYYSNTQYHNLRIAFQKMKELYSGTVEYEEALKIYDVVLKFEDELKQENEEKTASLNKLKKQFDDVSGITWYYNPYFTHYDNRNNISIYIGQRKTGDPWLRIKMSYYGEDWIFFEKAYISYEGNTMEIKFDRYKDKESDNSSNVWEWIDVSVTSKTLKFLGNFAESTDAKMRLSGKYTKTRNLTNDERKGIIDVLNGYDVLVEKTMKNT